MFYTFLFIPNNCQICHVTYICTWSSMFKGMHVSTILRCFISYKSSLFTKAKKDTFHCGMCQIKQLLWFFFILLSNQRIHIDFKPNNVLIALILRTQPDLHLLEMKSLFNVYNDFRSIFLYFDMLNISSCQLNIAIH